MKNFIYQNPTKLIFGKGQIERLSKELGRYGKRILWVYGGGTIKKTGIYEKILDNLHDFEIFELSNVEPNPRVSSANNGIAIVKEHNIDVILAVGGGSVIDCSKLIAAAAYYEGDAWDVVIGKHKPTKALPFGTILTISATGSEMNMFSVITNENTQEKFDWASPLVYPKFSILDPSYTFTLPTKQTINGIVDSMSHLLEQYFNEVKNTPLQDAMIEGILREIMIAAKEVLQNPQSYPARETLMLGATLGLNGYMSWGYSGDWATHMIEHAISAVYDIAHAEGLAIIMPNWMTYVMPNHVTRFAKFGRNVFNLSGEDYKVAKESIKQLREFWSSIGAPTKLSNQNITNEHIKKMANHATINGTIGNLEKLDFNDVKKILEMSL